MLWNLFRPETRVFARASGDEFGGYIVRLCHYEKLVLFVRLWYLANSGIVYRYSHTSLY